MINTKDVLDFLHRRWPDDSHFMDGNCYYFAMILKERFPELKIYYLPVDGHFVVGDGKTFYDFEGEHQYNDKTPINELDWIKNTDPGWYNRLMWDCWS